MNKVREMGRGRSRRFAGVLLLVALVGVSPALAVTAQIDGTAVATQATADIQGVFDDALPVLTAAIGLSIGWKYLKKFFMGV